jgi:hypothetical protein
VKRTNTSDASSGCQLAEATHARLWQVWACAVLCIVCSGCGKNSTDSDACKALVRDLRIEVGSPLGKALIAERFTRDRDSGNCVIETDRERLTFNVPKRTFTIVRGANYKIFGIFLIGDSGELKARFEGQAHEK